MVPTIQSGWIEQLYLYVPGTVSTTVNVCPSFKIPDFQAFAPLGTTTDWTVCWTKSKSFHTIVLFTPITTVILEGAKFSDSLFPTSRGSTIWTVPGWVEVELV